LLYAAFPLQYTGLLAERWFFFAQAKAVGGQHAYFVAAFTLAALDTATLCLSVILLPIMQSRALRPGSAVSARVVDPRCRARPVRSGGALERSTTGA